MKNYFIAKDFLLTNYNTLKICCKAKNVFFPFTILGFIEILKKYKNKKIIILGKGSNVLLIKKYYDEKYVFIITKLLNNIKIKNKKIIAEAGTLLSDIAWFACEQSISEMEFFEDIPGTVGGALYTNAGQWKYSISQFIHWIKIFNIKNNKISYLKPKKNFFSYRKSKLNDMKYVFVLEVSFNIKKKKKIKEILKKIFYYRCERYAKQPRTFSNAGSTFKRPVDKNGNYFYIWKLLDGVGLRGFRYKNAMISKKHPGFIINLNNAKGSDILYIINICKKKIKKKYNIFLELEWKII